ncbi:DUF1302 family protein [Marinimicrobium alkaliphilum]|uniref:DUF1302 family protein n=1 Tax=Marinimicrobium alkaliphilum TaxID=2202654 RepID=UPI000DBA2F9D|nr:DUF1302 family protein [Marinimicrobium alkaliphilum]
MARAWLLGLLILVALPARADDFFGTVETRASAEPASDDSPWRHRGWLNQRIGYGYRAPAAPVARDGADLTRVETEVYSQWDWRRGPWRARLSGTLTQDWLPDMNSAGLWSGYDFTDEQSSQRRWRAEISDSYLSWESGDWWLLGGYQTLAWGEAESLRVTDVLSRRDQRWPGQEELDDLRQPVPAVRATWGGRLDLVLLPETPPDRLPAAGDEFDPYLAWRDADTPTLHMRRRHDVGWALRWQTQRPGWDMQWLLAEVNSVDRYPHVQRQEGDETVIELAPWRQQVAGLALQTTRGAWVLRTEQALHRKLPLMPEDPTGRWPEHDQWRAMVSAEYAGIRDLTLTLELSESYTRDHSAELAQDQWQTGASARVHYTLLNERLALTGQAVRLPGGEGEVLRLSADWTLSDRLSLGASLVDYSARAASDQLYPYRHNDTLLLSVQWNL